MNSQSEMAAASVFRTRELKAENTRLKAEIESLRTENSSLRNNFALALVAAHDLAALPPDGRLIVVDAWNVILSARTPENRSRALFPVPHGSTPAERRAALSAFATDYLAAHPLDSIWLIYDGADERSTTTGRLRITFTGGEGLQRADDFIAAFFKACRLLSLTSQIHLETFDKRLLKRCKL